MLAAVLISAMIVMHCGHEPYQYACTYFSTIEPSARVVPPANAHSQNSAVNSCRTAEPSRDM